MSMSCLDCSITIVQKVSSGRTRKGLWHLSVLFLTTAGNLQCSQNKKLNKNKNRSTKQNKNTLNDSPSSRKMFYTRVSEGDLGFTGSPWEMVHDLYLLYSPAQDRRLRLPCCHRGFAFFSCNSKVNTPLVYHLSLARLSPWLLSLLLWALSLPFRMRFVGPWQGCLLFKEENMNLFWVLRAAASYGVVYLDTTQSWPRGEDSGLISVVPDCCDNCGYTAPAVWAEGTAPCLFAVSLRWGGWEWAGAGGAESSLTEVRLFLILPGRPWPQASGPKHIQAPGSRLLPSRLRSSGPWEVLCRGCLLCLASPLPHACIFCLSYSHPSTAQPPKFLTGPLRPFSNILELGK